MRRLAWHGGRLVWPLLFFFQVASGTAAPLRGEAFEPRWLRLQLHDIWTELEVENRSEEQSRGGQTSTEDYLLVLPSVHFGLAGSVFHPNLLAFDLEPQLGLSWEQLDRRPGEGSTSAVRFPQRYHADIDILRQKPYATSFYADQEFAYRDLDFFTRARIQSRDFGAVSGYRDGPVPFTVDLSQREQETRGTRSSDSDRVDRVARFLASHKRAGGGKSDFGYRYSEFEQRDEGVPDINGTAHNAHFNDRMPLGTDEWVQLDSSLSYYDLDSSTQSTLTLTVLENLRLVHDDRWTSRYQAGYDHRRSGRTESDFWQGRASLQHQLYRSLNSTWEVDGQQLESTADSSVFTQRRFGTRFRERYLKQLGSAGRLSAGLGLGISHERRESDGNLLIIEDERQVLSDGEVTFLSQPNPDPLTVVVTDASGTVFYREGFDYRLLERGVFLQIERVVGGDIPNGGVVLIDYEAAIQPSDSFQRFDQHADIRLDLFGRLLGMYARFRSTSFWGNQNIVLDDLTEVVAGIGHEWEWFRAGAEYQVYDSELSPFRALHFFQSADFRPTESLAIGCDFTQDIQYFEDPDTDRASYRFIGRLGWRPWPRLTWDTEAGFLLEDGLDTDRQLVTVRTKIGFAYGQLKVRLEYWLEEDQYREERRLEHNLSLRVRRDF